MQLLISGISVAKELYPEVYNFTVSRIKYCPITWQVVQLLDGNNIKRRLTYAQNEEVIIGQEDDINNNDITNYCKLAVNIWK